MNQHFIYNTLNNVQYYIKKGEKEASLTCISSLGRLLRQWMRDAEQPAVSITAELRALEGYLELEQMRFPGRLRFEVVSAVPGSDAVFMLPHIIFPLAEHAVGWCLKHPGAGMIRIQAVPDPPFIRCTVVAEAGGESLTAALHLLPVPNNENRLCNESSL